MPISDDHRLSVWREVLQLCRVKAGENVVVLTGEGSLVQNVDMAIRASAAMGAKVCRIDVPPLAIGGGFGSRASVEVTPLTGHRLVVDTLKQADMVLDLMGLLHSPEQLEILAAQTRMLMVIEPPEMLARMIPTTDDKRRVQAAGKLLKAAQADPRHLQGGYRPADGRRPISDVAAMGLLGRAGPLGSLAERIRRHLAE